MPHLDHHPFIFLKILAYLESSSLIWTAFWWLSIEKCWYENGEIPLDSGKGRKMWSPSYARHITLTYLPDMVGLLHCQSLSVPSKSTYSRCLHWWTQGPLLCTLCCYWDLGVQRKGNNIRTWKLQEASRSVCDSPCIQHKEKENIRPVRFPQISNLVEQKEIAFTVHQSALMPFPQVTHLYTGHRDQGCRRSGSSTCWGPESWP